MADVNKSFGGEKGFCSNCGSILPMLGDGGTVKCFMCKFEYGHEAFGAMENHYEINFNAPKVSGGGERNSEMSHRTSGPVIERRCGKCGNDTMTYATLQLRSADEGQTVFYTCTKCGHKETENS